jgi:hypothetical protein
MRSHGLRLSSQVSTEAVARTEKLLPARDSGAMNGADTAGVGGSNGCAASRAGAAETELDEPRRREAFLRIRMERSWRDLPACRARVWDLRWEAGLEVGEEVSWNGNGERWVGFCFCFAVRWRGASGRLVGCQTAGSMFELTKAVSSSSPTN